MMPINSMTIANAKEPIVPYGAKVFQNEVIILISL
jgi:hypothetical protein